MKRARMMILGVAVAAGLCLGVSSFAWEMKGKDKAAEEQETKGNKMCKTCDKGAMGETGGRMMGETAERKVVATSDGGIVILTGNTIIKYDKDLNLVKEAEIKGASESMHKAGMGKMNGMKGCPMMKGGMMKDEKEVKAPAAAVKK